MIAGWREKRRVEFFVSGIPQPQPHKGAAVNRQTGRPYTFIREGPWAQWRADIRRMAQERLAGEPAMTGPIEISLVFRKPRPQSGPKKRAMLPVKQPDLSNYIKCVEDALLACAYRDDAQIVGCQARKLYSDDGICGVEIGLSELEAESPTKKEARGKNKSSSRGGRDEQQRLIGCDSAATAVGQESG